MVGGFVAEQFAEVVVCPVLDAKNDVSVGQFPVWPFLGIKRRMSLLAFSLLPPSHALQAAHNRRWFFPFHADMTSPVFAC